MYVVKVFRTSELPNATGAWFVAQDHFVRDGFTAYTVGYFAKEAARSPGDHSREDATACKRLDRFLMAAGASDGEEVLIEHG